MICRPEWKKPSFGQKTLTKEEKLIAHTLSLRCDLRSSKTRKAEVEMARQRYENKPLYDPQGELDRYDEFMKKYIEQELEFRAHGMPRQWSKQIDLFWYWVATRQQYDETT